MVVPTKDQVRKRIRRELTKDIKNPLHDVYKPKVAIQKNPSTKEKFLKNPRKTKQPGELPL